MICPKVPEMLFGGDYAPEQWPRSVWNEDMRLMKEAGVNLVSIAVFNWVKIEPRDGEYTFEWLDEVMDMLTDNGIYADLGTSTASPPIWMSRKYPDILPVTKEGVRISYGSRQAYCPSSPSYRRKSDDLVRVIAEHYKDHPALAMWHINNEISHHVKLCYCENCEKRFQNWIREKYKTLNNLHQAWGMECWGQLVEDWSEIIPPRLTSQQLNPSLLLDFRRCMSDAFLEIYVAESRILRKITPDIPQTTTFPYEFKTADYFKWAKEMDFVSLTMFPDPKETQPISEAAMSHDLFRGFKNGQPYALLEQASSNTCWRNVNTTKRPGINRLWSYQAMAHGSEAFLYFQWRQSHHGPEKHHSAMLPHYGKESRVFKEVCQLGNELKNLSEIVNSRVPAEVGFLMDYDSWWALMFTPGLSNRLSYLDELKHHYYPLHELNIPTEIIGQDADFSRFKVIVAPLAHMLKPGVAERLEKFVADGGTFFTTFYSAAVDETDGIFLNGAPGPLTDVLGIRVEEYDPLKNTITNAMIFETPFGELEGEYPCELWCDVINATTARTLACYKSDFYAGRPCLTENQYGDGKAYYLATHADSSAICMLLKHICAQQDVAAPLDVPSGIEVVPRVKEGAKYLFVLNHNSNEVVITAPEGEHIDMISGDKISGKITIPSKDLVILKSQL
ncbi:MAG: beta-galactosidase [Planctomycetota bacterium]